MADNTYISKHSGETLDNAVDKAMTAVQSISVNGTPQSKDANNNVDLTIPGGSGNVDDVQIEGNSILSNKIANITIIGVMSNLLTTAKDKLVNAINTLSNKVDKVSGSSLVPNTKVTSYDSHLNNTNNPHNVTKSQLGLNNVDNTSDADKPVSTAQQTELNKKVNISQGASNANKLLYINSSGNVAMTSTSCTMEFSSKTIDDYNHTWCIITYTNGSNKMITAISTTNPALIYASKDGTNWYLPYSEWRA